MKALYFAWVRERIGRQKKKFRRQNAF